MDKDSNYNLLHTLIAATMMAPIFVFYAYIAMEVIGYPQPVERYTYVSTASLAKICSAFATDKLQSN